MGLRQGPERKLWGIEGREEAPDEEVGREVSFGVE